jgi:cytochrome oxidase Cu insertion factor (SCO1/SenC/PrrC family)
MRVLRKCIPSWALSLIAMFIAVGATALHGLTPAMAAAPPGAPAPGFSLTDVSGKAFSLKDFSGRWVALEWVNPECPFVKKHYQSGNMQSTQKQAADSKVVWVQINSTNANHSEYKSPKEMAAWNTEMKTVGVIAALDSDGKVGRAYGAKTTPQMVLINPQGLVVYHGAIDSIRSANAADIARATNYMKQAMTEALSGKPVSVPESVPYGCTVKY